MLKFLKKKKEVDPEFLRLSKRIDDIINEDSLVELIEEAKENNCYNLEIFIFLDEDVYDKPMYINRGIKTVILDWDKMILDNGNRINNEFRDKYKNEVNFKAFTTIKISTKMLKDRDKWIPETNIDSMFYTNICKKYEGSILFCETDMEYDEEIDNIDYLLQTYEITKLKSIYYNEYEELVVPCIYINIQHEG